MDDTDFDALCEGLSADEVKRLRRILATWAAGDEHSFPVQMALLTRAQWRVAARVPRQLSEASELLDRKLAEYRNQTAALIQNLDQTTAAKIRDLASIISSQHDATAKAVAGFQGQLANAETVASQILYTLEQGSLAWKQAKTDFEAERQKLDASRQELDSRNSKRDWLRSALLLLGAIGLGIAIGLWLSQHTL